MVNVSNKHGETVSDVLRATFEVGEEFLVVNPTAGTITELIDIAAADSGDTPHLRLLGTNRTLKDAFEEFLVASNAADLIESGRLEVREATLPQNTLLITASAVFALVGTDRQAAALGSDHGAFVEAVTDAAEIDWDSAEEYSLRTPPLSRVRETLAEEIGDPSREEFDRLLRAVATADAGTEVDEVVVSLLVAGRNEVLLYDISRWGEYVGIASKATFSRTKTQLEEHGLIDTEKVPIDVGRPRLRLQLGDGYEDLDADELVGAVRSALVG